MKRTRHSISSSFFIALLGILFCLWSAFGNDVNICVTAGCSLYEDFTLAGISMWWFGTGVFVLLAVLALLGLGWLGLWVSRLALVCDVLLLLLLALTAPCISCMGVAIFFALTYLTFRQHERAEQHSGRTTLRRRQSLLLWVWLLLFTVNVGTVIRSETGLWHIQGDDETATVHMYFSPSCPTCRQGVELLSGHIDVAFYPVADDALDLYRVAQMQKLLDAGQNLASALHNSLETQEPPFWDRYTPELLLLHFRLLRNKAHIIAAGSDKVPFMEYHGLPAALLKQTREKSAPKEQPAAAPAPKTEHITPAPVQPFPDDAAEDAGASAHDGHATQPRTSGKAAQSSDLPLEPLTAGSCNGSEPCDDAASAGQTRRPRTQR